MFKFRYLDSTVLIFKLIFIKWFALKTSKTNQILTNQAFGKTYKFPLKAHSDRLILLKYYIKILLFKVEKQKVLSKDKVVLDIGFASVENRKGFIACFAEEEIETHVGLSALRFFPSFFHKVIYFVLTFPLFLMFFIVSLFSNYRVNLALMLEVIVVNKNLVDVLEKTKIVYFFSIFELESNFYAYYLIKSGIQVIKIAADVPLVYWNQNIIASTLVLCNAYQLEEVKAFSKTIIIDELLLWGPENYEEIKLLYQDVENEPPKNKIGFYSSASWVRREEGDYVAGNLFEHEVSLCSALNYLLMVDKELELTIFLHPREKRGAFKDKSLAHYKNLFKGGNYKIGDVNLPSANSFREVNLAISVGSTLMYERLYCGFKVIFFQNENDVPIEGSSLSNIWFKNDEDFFKKVKESLNITTREFFKVNRISHYSPKYQNDDI